MTTNTSEREGFRPNVPKDQASGLDPDVELARIADEIRHLLTDLDALIASQEADEGMGGK